MTLASQVSALATRVATEIKATKTAATGTRINWRARASGQTIDTGTLAFDDGAAGYALNLAAYPAVTANGRLETGPAWPTTATTAAAYYNGPSLGAKVTRAWCTFGLGSWSDDQVGAVLVGAFSTIGIGASTVSHMHMTSSRVGWAYSVIETNTVITQIASGTYGSPLPNDFTECRMEVSIIGATALIALPDGTTTTVTDSRIASIGAQIPTFEFYRNPVAGNASMAYYDFGADTVSEPLGVASRASVARMIRSANKPQTVTYAATVTPNAATGSTFRCTATGALAVNVPTGGADGQIVRLWVNASGADRTVTMNGSYEVSQPVPGRVFIVPSGTWGEVLTENRNGTWVLLAAYPQPYSQPSPTTQSVAGGAVTVNCQTNSLHAVTTTANITSLTVSGTATDGQRMVVEVYASGGARTVTHGLARLNGLDTVLSVASAKIGVLGLYYSTRAGHWVLSSFNIEV